MNQDNKTLLNNKNGIISIAPVAMEVHSKKKREIWPTRLI